MPTRTRMNAVLYLGIALWASAMVSESASADQLPGNSLWAFQPIRKPQLPVAASGSAQNPIDRFIADKLKTRGLAQAPRANALVLLRRVCFDLTGLPPSLAEIERFSNDPTSETYSRLLDELLATPQYAERWARHWLDLVRYADTGGFEKDLLYRNAWKYRDYVIRSFGANKSIDRFLQEQIAGDELWPDDPDAQIATGLYAVGPVSQDSTLNSTQLEYEWLTDTVDTTAAAFLGLTLGCARCHDHKYDPLTQTDYYAMQAIFAASDRPYPKEVRDLRIKGLNGILADVPIPKEFQGDPRCTIRLEDQWGTQLFHRDTPMEIHRLQRGELSKPRETVGPAIPAVFAATDFDPARAPAGQRRAMLARWLVSHENPLTARVVVNHVWAWHFGQGIVRTLNDFGVQGEPPSHPALLDWLAADFVEHRWDLRRLHRLILSSATYQMESVNRAPKAREIDPENRLLSHFPRHRLEAEAIWDAMHSCAGTLNLKQFGPPIVPPLTKDELSGLFGDEKWKITEDAGEYGRRGIYLFERRTFVFPLFDAFDPPDVMASCPRRFNTTLPTQALALLNSRIALGQAESFARRLLRDCASAPDEIPGRAWLLAFGRPISAEEAERARSFLQKHLPAASGLHAVSAGAAPDQTALTELCLALFNSNEFVFVD